MTKTEYRRYMTTILIAVAVVALFMPFIPVTAYVGYLGFSSAIVSVNLATKVVEDVAV